MRRLRQAMQNKRCAVVIALYGHMPRGLGDRLQDFHSAGLLVVVVNNNTEVNPTCTSSDLFWLENGNNGGLAGGLNRGVAHALQCGCELITLLDQDSELSAITVSALQLRVEQQPNLIVGPAIWDVERQRWHTPPQGQPRLLITSGTTFNAGTWRLVGPYHDWMEIDYIDHEWCCRASRLGLRLQVLEARELPLKQHFGQRHPNPLAHRLGIQLYSPYRRAVALRNLRWLVQQNHVPLDIRFKEVMKMMLKPWCWLALEPAPAITLRYLWAGLQAPLGKPFPRATLKEAKL